MADMLKGVDPNETIKAIRAKLRDDAIAMRKNGKGRVRRRPVKNFRRFGNKNASNSAPAAKDGTTAAAAPATEAAPAAAETKTQEAK